MHYRGVTLEELLGRYLAQDDEDAMAALVRETRPKLLAVAKRICGADADDAVQTAYLSLAKRGGLGGAPVLPWLLTAVARIAYRARATHRKEHAIAERLAPSAAPPQPPDVVIGREEADLLRRELWRLPPDYRDALQLRYLHGLSGAEVARLLGVNESTLRTRLERGRLLLRSRLARVLHPFVALPWLLKDSAALALGGTVKAKLAIAMLLLAALGLFYVTSRDRTPPPRARTDTAASAADALRTAAEVETSEQASGGETGAALQVDGIVVDQAGAPVEGVRLIVRASVRDEHLLRQIQDHYRSHGEEAPPDAGFRPELINDALRGRAHLARTDREGRFSAQYVAGPRETVLFLKEGYAAHQEKEVASGMRVVLLRACHLHGRVTDTSGAPIGGASVRASTGYLESVQDTETDREGQYEFLCLPSLRAISAVAHGYEHAFVTSVGEMVDLQLKRKWLIVDVTDAETKAPLLSACARLGDKEGQPLERHLRAWPGRQDRSTGRCVVGPDVSKELKQGRTVEAVVHVFAPGYLPVLEPVIFRPEEEPPHLRIALYPGKGPPSLAGRVTGTPVAHIVVRNPNHLAEDYELITEADTEPGGRFLFSGLPRSDYLLVVTAPGMGKVTRRATAPTDDIEIGLKPAAVLEVLARDGRGAPVAGTAIHVEQPDGKRHWTAKTDERGWAVFEDLPAQDLEVAAVVEGWNRPIHGQGVPTKHVMPTAGARTQLTVALPEPLPVVILVRDETGRPHEGVILSFDTRLRGLVRAVGKTEYERLQSLRVTTDAQGEAEAKLYQGEYNVMLAVDPTPVRVARLDVEEERQNRVECVVPFRLTVVRGRLREYGTDQPIRSAILSVLGADSMALANARTDDKGRFEIRGLAKEKHRLRRLLLSDEVAPLFCDIDLSDRDEIDVELYAVSKVAPGTDQVAVTVRSAATGPLSSARVSVLGKFGDGWAILSKATTDLDGCAVVRVLEAERYRVWAYATDHETADTTVERKGQRTEVVIDLAAAK